MLFCNYSNLILYVCMYIIKQFIYIFYVLVPRICIVFKLINNNL